MNDERGIVTIYFSLVMICIIFLIFVLLDITRIKYDNNKIKKAGLIAGHSVMADYNNELWKRYGLLTLRDLDGYIIEDNFKNELLKNLKANDMNRIEVVSTHIQNSNSLYDSKELENQIVEHTKNITLNNTYNFIKNSLSEDLNETNESENETIDVLTEEEWVNKTTSFEDKREENLKEANGYIESDEKKDIIISEALLQNLPSKKESYYKKSKIDYDGLVNDSNDLCKSIIKMMPLDDYLNIYIFDKFSMHIADEKYKDIQKHFDLEIEYIICGAKSQNENLSEVKRKIIMCRLPIHIARIYKDKVLMAEIEAAAQIAVGWWATPIAATILKNAMVCSIALKDSIKDVSKLLNGGKVKVSNTSEVYIDYKGYLHLLLLTVPKKDKLNRIKDIIYLNMNKINFQFLLENALTKFNMDIVYKENLMLIDKVKYSNLYNINKSNHKVTVCLGY